MHSTVIAAIASAAVVAAIPHRREAFDASKFPDCPAAIISLLPGCIDNPFDTCFANAPEFPEKCLEEIKKLYPALPGLPNAATAVAPVAAAPVAATPPHRREAFDASKFPDCPAPVINLLPGCIANPFDTCFASAPEFPQKCLDEIKKFYPALPGLPAAAVVAANAAPGGASPPHRREAFDASKFPDCPAPVISLLPGCIANPFDTCFASAPEFPQKCLDEIKKLYPALPGLPTAAVAAPAAAAPAPAAAAPGSAAPPHRRQAFDASKFPDCPPAIINLLPGCIANPFDTCFANAPQFPQKCLDEIRKFYPALPGLPASGN